MRKLKYAEVADTRAEMLKAQGHKCALCGLPLSADKAVLDHDHKTGIVRAALHASCNSLLGKVENNAPRYGVPNLSAFLHGAAKYLQNHSDNRTGLLHPTHKTDEEKRVLRNKKARVARAVKKAAE